MIFCAECTRGRGHKIVTKNKRKRREEMFKKAIWYVSKKAQALAKSTALKTAAVVGVVGGMIAEAHAEVTLPTTGVDVGEYITAGITAVAAVIGVAVGGYIAFLIVRKALKWSSKAMG